MRIICQRLSNSERIHITFALNALFNANKKCVYTISTQHLMMGSIYKVNKCFGFSHVNSNSTVIRPYNNSKFQLFCYRDKSKIWKTGVSIVTKIEKLRSIIFSKTTNFPLVSIIFKMQCDQGSKLRIWFIPLFSCKSKEFTHSLFWSIFPNIKIFVPHFLKANVRLSFYP